MTTLSVTTFSDGSTYARIDISGYDGIKVSKGKANKLIKQMPALTKSSKVTNGGTTTITYSLD